MVHLPPVSHHLPPVAQVAKIPHRIAGIVKIPPTQEKSPSGEVAYSALVCTEVDKQNIAFLISTIAQHGKLALLFRASELKRVGAEINHVHPFKFLATIFSDPDLKMHMMGIYDDYFKWNNLMEGLGPSLTTQQTQGKLEFYLKDFAAEVNVPVDAIRGYVQAMDWESFVRYLIMN